MRECGKEMIIFVSPAFHISLRFLFYSKKTTTPRKMPKKTPKRNNPRPKKTIPIHKRFAISPWGRMKVVLRNKTTWIDVVSFQERPPRTLEK